MKFNPPLIEATLVRRYKRFLADVRFANDTTITVHCPNPGAMLGLTEPGNRVWISDSQNPKRKLQYTLELMEVLGPAGNTLVGINTMHPNKLALEAIRAGRIPQLAKHARIRTEVRYGNNSRIDLLLEDDGSPDCYVEVKNVHLVRKAGLHEFPDCKTARGTKHLLELAEMTKSGARAVMLYVIQREDGDAFSLAGDLDPQYASTFRAAMDCGVEALAVRCQITPEEITACTTIPIVLDSQAIKTNGV